MTFVSTFNELDFCLRDHGYDGLNLVNFLYDEGSDQVSFQRLEDARLLIKTHPELKVQTRVQFKLVNPVIHIDETSKYAKALFHLDMLENVETWEQYWNLIERGIFSLSECLHSEIVSYLETIDIAESADNYITLLYSSPDEFIKNHSLLLSHPSAEKACRRLIRHTEKHIRNCIWFSYKSSFIKDCRFLLSYFQAMLGYRETCKLSNVLKLEKVINNVVDLDNTSRTRTQVVDNLVFFKGIVRSYF